MAIIVTYEELVAEYEAWRARISPLVLEGVEHVRRMMEAGEDEYEVPPNQILSEWALVGYMDAGAGGTHSTVTCTSHRMPSHHLAGLLRSAAKIHE